MLLRYYYVLLLVTKNASIGFKLAHLAGSLNTPTDPVVRRFDRQ